MTNKEFNITLQCLDVFNSFVYYDEDTYFQEILNLRANAIVLIHGHYTIVKKEQGDDLYGHSPHKSEKVYCYWLQQQMTSEYNETNFTFFYHKTE